MEAPMTAADVAAVMGNRDGDGWGNNSGMWIFALIILFGFMRGGFGGWGEGGGQPVTESALCNANSFNELKSQVGRMSDQQAAIARQTDNAICNLGYENAQLASNLQLQMSQGFAAQAAQAAQCCCDTKQLILETQYKAEQNKCEILAAVREGDWNAERRAMEQKIDALTAQNAQMANAYQAEQTRNYIAEQFCGVPKLPMNFTYAVPFNGFGNCCSTGCNNGTFF